MDELVDKPPSGPSVRRLRWRGAGRRDKGRRNRHQEPTTRGLFPDTTYQSTLLALEPGDRVVLITDGMLERNAAGIDLSAAIQETRALHPREAARGLADSVLRATGHDLRDDATVLVLDWHGGHDLERSTASGADQTRASYPLA